MSNVPVFEPGGYRFIKGAFQYSGGVAAQPGFTIRRVVFSEPLPLVEGFAAAERIITADGRPLTSFCACELRSPAPFTEQGFKDFNLVYVGTLSRWGIYDGKINPVARSNVCPKISPPPAPSLHAFSFTEAVANAPPAFVISGSGEAPEGAGSYFERTIRRGDTTPGGMREKARYVIGEMERRMGLLGLSWRDTTGVQVYTVQDFHPFLEEELARRGAARNGLTWHYCRPPVVDLEFEMDCRGVTMDQNARHL
jgi:hypothetical protein